MEQRFIVSYSGGKDSTAMLLRLIELNYPVDDIIYCNSGVDYPGQDEYVDKIEKYISRKITRLSPEYSFFDGFYRKKTKGKYIGEIRGFPMTLSGCWWQNVCKIKPMSKYTRGNFVYLGICSNEQKRSTAKRGFCAIYPLVMWDWTEDRCIRYLKEKGLFPEFYGDNKRNGCWICPKQSCKSLRIIWSKWPQLWSKLKVLEHDSPQGFKYKYPLNVLEQRFKHGDFAPKPSV